MSAIATTTAKTIQITEIKASNFPQSTDYRYRCSVTLHSDDGKTKLQKSLLTRLQPNWLVDIKHTGDCKAKITISYRQGDITNPWQDLEAVEFATEEVLNNNDRFKELEFAISSWNIAPEFKIAVSLGASQNSSNSNDKLNLLTNIKDNGLYHKKRREATNNQDDTPVILPEATLLTPQEIVIVKDVWNKLRAWKELEMEQFFKRLLLEEPELEYLFDEAIDSMSDYFFELFDRCVRNLAPQTENVITEPMMGVPPEKEQGFNSVEEYGALFADIGMQPKHWLKARQVWMWMLPTIPYLEEYDRENLNLGSDSALDKFFNTHVILPMVEAIDRYQSALPPSMLLRMADSWSIFSQYKREMGMEFYQILFNKYPFVLPIFGRADMDYLSLHLFESLEFLVRCLKSGSSDAMLRELRMLGQLHGNVGVPSSAYPAISDTMFVLFEKYVPNFDDELKQAWQTLFDRVTNIMKLPKINEERLLKKARQFLNIISKEQGWSEEARLNRWQEIESQVQATGTYTHTYEELAYGAQLSWRNASKCIARIQWSNMIVRDCRQVTEPDEMFKQLEEHLRLATNGGNIQIVMSVFRPKLPKERWGPRIWNSQLIRYAAYTQPDGTILGDGANLELTEAIIELGWQPPEQKSDYDILPLVIEVPGKKPQLYEWKKDDVLEVPITHPSIPEFASLGLRWYAIPAISNFRMDIGGITYGCLPFNGWYMETELTRDFLEDWRYDRMEDIAQLLNLDTSSESSLWRDRVALETNIAILHSFQTAKVSMVDHQSASRQFLSHDLREKKSGRECPADYGWVVPPSGGSTCPVWHHQMRDFYLDPAYHHGADRWAVEKDIDLEQFIITKQDEDDLQERILILYASETGTAEGFARKSSRQLQQHKTQVMALDEYDLGKISQEKLLIVITSTFGNGAIPSNGRKFLQWLKQQAPNSLSHLNYAVLGIGSTVYEHFCAAGIAVDKGLRKAGANSIVPLHKADEIKGQASTFKQWLGLIARVLGDDLNSSATSLTAPKLEVTFLDSLIAETTIADSQQGVRVPLVANKELLQKVVAGSRSTRYIAFDISNTELSYETGDHLSVHPCNPCEIVDRLCKRLNLDPEAYFTASYVTSDGKKLDDEIPIQVPTTVRQVLTEELDLSLREPIEELLSYLNSVVTNPQEKNTLTTWLEIISQGNGDEDTKNLIKSLLDKFMTIVDLFDEFPSASIDLGSLLEILPQQKPRLYSISSSNLLHPKKIQLTVGVLQIKTDAGKIRQGLCSNYLANLQPQQTARIGVNTSSFRPPENPHAPILMVGPGTGISPLIAFMEYRQALLEQGETLGEAHLYFGCRNYDDFIYQEQLKQWRRMGVLSYVAVAFSRLEKQKKTYVQNMMENKPAQVWKMLSHPECHYYVCGDAKMADNVFDTMYAIAKSTGKLSHIEAVEFFDKMKQEKRFYSDVWGVTLNYKKAIKEVQQDNYSKAEKWLESVQT